MNSLCWYDPEIQIEYKRNWSTVLRTKTNKEANRKIQPKYFWFKAAEVLIFGLFCKNRPFLPCRSQDYVESSYSPPEKDAEFPWHQGDSELLLITSFQIYKVSSVYGIRPIWINYHPEWSNVSNPDESQWMCEQSSCSQRITIRISRGGTWPLLSNYARRIFIPICAMTKWEQIPQWTLHCFFDEVPFRLLSIRGQ